MNFEGVQESCKNKNFMGLLDILDLRTKNGNE